MKLLLACCVALLLGACAGVRHEVAAEKDFISGQIGQVHAATLGALREMSAEVAKQNQDAFSSRIDGRFSDGNTFSVVTNQVTSREVEVSILIGAFGSKNRSIQLLERIRAHMPQ